jgi:hypothetical protein
MLMGHRIRLRKRRDDAYYDSLDWERVEVSGCALPSAEELDAVLHFLGGERGVRRN